MTHIKKFDLKNQRHLAYKVNVYGKYVKKLLQKKTHSTPLDEK